MPPCKGLDAFKWNNCHGSWTAPSGNKYVGEWKNGERNGYFTATYTSGDKYVGEFKDGVFNGQGTYYHLADDSWKGDKYVGEFKDDKRNGQGTYYFLADGEWKSMKFIGEWKDGTRKGQGIEYNADGSISKTGIWSDDKLVTSQYVDPNSFTRIAKGNSGPSAAETQRLENER